MNEDLPQEAQAPDKEIQPFIDALDDLARRDWLAAMTFCLRVLHRPDMVWCRASEPPSFVPNDRQSCFLFQIDGPHHYNAYSGPTSAERACALAFLLRHADQLANFVVPWVNLRRALGETDTQEPSSDAP
jgi:hypothetical protein